MQRKGHGAAEVQYRCSFFSQPPVASSHDETGGVFILTVTCYEFIFTSRLFELYKSIVNSLVHIAESHPIG